MPIVHIHVARGRPDTDRQAILDSVHAALVEAFRIPDQDRNQILHEHDPKHFESEKGPEFTLIELTVFPGRSLNAKRQLYAALVRNLGRAPGIAPEKVLVVLHEPSLTNWGIQGGKPGADVEIGFRLDA